MASGGPEYPAYLATTTDPGMIQHERVLCIYVLVEAWDDHGKKLFPIHLSPTHAKLGSPYWFRTRDSCRKFVNDSNDVYGKHLPSLVVTSFTAWEGIPQFNPALYTGDVYVLRVDKDGMPGWYALMAIRSFDGDLRYPMRFKEKLRFME